MDATSETAPLAKRLTGKVAIITGGASGLGKSTARLFAQHGAKVIIADIQDKEGESLCQEITSKGGLASYVHCDVTSDSDVAAAVDLAVSTHGCLDVMVNNAGIGGGMDTTVLGTGTETFKRVFNVNVTGSFLGAKEAARVMIPKRSGVVLFVSSVVSLVAGDGPHAYVASKHAVVGLMKSLCSELGQYGIRVNAVAPSTIATPLVTDLLMMEKSVLDGIIHESSVLKGVVPQPEDVAQAALYLASDDAKYVTGLNLVVDGGYSTTNKSLTNAMIKFMVANGALNI